jgi:RsiW-degrading membrane proteinase PrsW (M82 family)
MIEWALLIVLSFLPPLIYTIWIRNTEQYNREKWRTILVCFIWGGSIAILAVLIIEYILNISLFVSIDDYNTIGFLIVVIIAPVAEEFSKPLALKIKSVTKEINEFEDGLIYGAVAGLGFSATENLFYGWYFLSKGVIIFIILIGLRSFGGCLLHASATALTGYGYGKTILKHTTIFHIIPYFILAITVHSAYNFFLSFNMIGAFTGLIAAFSFVVFTITAIRRKIRILDLQKK